MTTSFAIVEDDFQGGTKKKKKKTNQRSELGEHCFLITFFIAFGLVST
jgi:hypothetical protein